MAELSNDAPWDELRRLWHALAGQRRAVKDDARFRAIHDLSPMETGVIDVVAETPEAIIGDVGRALGLPKSTLTSLIDRLEAQGYLRRVISRRDRRSYGLELTRKGRTAWLAHVRFETEVWQKMLAGLDGDGERKEFLALLRKIVAGMEGARAQ